MWHTRKLVLCVGDGHGGFKFYDLVIFHKSQRNNHQNQPIHQKKIENVVCAENAQGG